MKQSVTRYVVPNDIPENPPDKHQIEKAFKLCEKSDIKEVTLFVASKELIHDNPMQSVLTYDICTKLISARGEAIPFKSGSLCLHSLRTIHTFQVNSILAYTPTNKMFDCLDDMETKIIIVIPFNMDSISSWLATWPDVEIYGQSGEYHQTETLDPCLEKTISELTRSALKSLSILEPATSSAATSIFDKLRDKGKQFSQQQIEQSAKRHRWRSSEAKRLAVKFGQG